MDIKIWSKTNCPMCEKSKAFLKNKNIDFSVMTIGVNATKEDLLNLLPSARSVPQIFIDNVHIGGYNELISKFS